MRKFLKRVFRIVLLLVLLVVAVLIFRNSIGKWIVQWYLHDETGMEVKIGKIEIGLTASFIRVENLKLKNTPEFGGSTFLDVPEIYLEYDRDALTSGKFHATLARFDMSEVTVVRNQAGQTNVSVLKEHLEKVHLRKHRKPPEFNAIDELRLTLGKARYVDLKTPTNNYELNFFLQNETVKNIKSERDLKGIIKLAVIRNTIAMSGTQEDALNLFLRDPQGIIERTRERTQRLLDLLIPPKKPRKTSQVAAPTIRK